MFSLTLSHNILSLTNRTCVHMTNYFIIFNFKRAQINKSQSCPLFHMCIKLSISLKMAVDQELRSQQNEHSWILKRRHDIIIHEYILEYTLNHDEGTQQFLTAHRDWDRSCISTLPGIKFVNFLHWLIIIYAKILLPTSVSYIWVKWWYSCTLSRNPQPYWTAINSPCDQHCLSPENVDLDTQSQPSDKLKCRLHIRGHISLATFLVHYTCTHNVILWKFYLNQNKVNLKSN